MEYFISETLDGVADQKTAGSKARIDVNSIFAEEIDNPIFLKIPSGFGQKGNLLKKINGQLTALKGWKNATKNLKSGDRVFIQFPFFVHSVFLSKVFKKLKKRKVELIFLVHDLTWVQTGSSTAFRRKMRICKEREQFNYADKYIVHNDKMAEYLVDSGIDKNKLIILEIFDYLIPEYNEERISQRKNEKSGPIIIAGNLAQYKSKYVYDLPNSGEWNLFGPNYSGEEKEFVHYMGAFPPDELPYELNGSFGLIWDGDSCDTCSGKWGEYLKINNPHKTSLCLASGIPVIIWKEAALADFIIENRCGLAVSSLTEIALAISNLTDEQYDEMCRNAKKTGQMLRGGHFTKKAIEKILK